MKPRLLRASTGIALLLGVSLVHPTITTAQQRTLTIRHVNVVNVVAGSIEYDREVVVIGNRITANRPNTTRRGERRARSIYGRGLFLMPGLWDAHTHLSYLGSCSLPQFVAHGVTSVRDLGSRPADIAEWREKARAGKLVTPQILSSGENLESAAWLARAYKILPQDNLLWRYGPRIKVADPDQAARAVDRLANGGSQLIKFRNLTPDAVRAAGAEAKRRNIPLAGHAPKMELGEAAEAGVRSIEHAETVSLALGDRPDAERATALLRVARADAFITPTLVNFSVNHLTLAATIVDWLGPTSRDPRRRSVSAETLALWRITYGLKYVEGEQDWLSLYNRQVSDMRLAIRAGVSLLAGTDVGSVPGQFPGASLHDELAALVRDVGLTPVQALRTATVNPDRFFAGYTRSGRIIPGQRADLLLVAGNPLNDIANARRIRAVVLAGELFDSTALASMKAQGCKAGG